MLNVLGYTSSPVLLKLPHWKLVLFVSTMSVTMDVAFCRLKLEGLFVARCV